MFDDGIDLYKNTYLILVIQIEVKEEKESESMLFAYP